MAARVRQMSLPLPKAGGRPARPWKRARRDLSATAFALALERHGFRQAAGGLLFEDMRGGCAQPLQGVYRTGPLRIARRATLAKIVRARSAFEAARPESQKESQ